MDQPYGTFWTATPRVAKSVPADRVRPAAPVREFLADVADVRPDGRPPLFAVLLTRVKPCAASTKVYHDLITEDGVMVLRAQVGSLEHFAQAWGDPIADVTNSAYGDAARSYSTWERSKIREDIRAEQ